MAVTTSLFEAGSMCAALLLSRLLNRLPDRPVMLGGTAIMIVRLFTLATGIAVGGLNWPLLLGSWLLTGLGYSAVLTPSGRLLRRSAHAGDRPAVFAAQFALSHACWLVIYPLAGWLMTQSGAVAALLALAMLAVLGVGLALSLWPAGDPVELRHRHDGLPLDHSHLQGHREHSHAYLIDDHHRHRVPHCVSSLVARRATGHSRPVLHDLCGEGLVRAHFDQCCARHEWRL